MRAVATVQLIVPIIVCIQLNAHQNNSKSEGLQLVPEVEVSTEENIEEAVENFTTKSKLKIQIFKGLGDNVSIEN